MSFVHLIDKNVRLYLSSVCASLSEQIYGPFHLSNNGLNQFILVPSMWFWSVSWSTNCPVFFSFFLVDQKKIVQSQGIFGQSLIFFGQPCLKFGHSLISEGDQFSNKAEQKKIRDWPKISWDWTIFFGRPKKMRKRPDNWLTKRLTKTTWTGLIYKVDH